MADLKEMDSLRRRNQEAVGFIPLSRYEDEIERSPTQVLTGWENGDMVAYLYWTRGIPVAPIQQLVVREDARRRDRGTAMVDAAIEHMLLDPRRYGATCRCRVDLEAVDFWQACGFKAVRLEESGRRGPCMRFFKELRPALFGLGLYLPFPTNLQSQRRGFRYTGVRD